MSAYTWWTASMIRKPQYLQTIKRQKNRPWRGFRLIDWRTTYIRRTTEMRNWNYSSRLCWNILKHGKHIKALVRVCLSSLHTWSSFAMYSAKDFFWALLAPVKRPNRVASYAGRTESKERYLKIYFGGMKGERFHCKYTMLKRFTDASEIFPDVMNALKHFVLFSEQRWQTKDDQVMSACSRKTKLEKEKSRNCGNCGNWQ